MSVESHQVLSLDTTQQKEFINWYKSKPESPETTVWIFDRNDYFSTHGKDASLAAKIIFKSISAVKVMGTAPKELPYLVLSKGNFEVLIRELILVYNYRVEIYQCKNVKANEWKVAYKASPGNYSELEDVLFSGQEIITSCGTLALKISGLATIKQLIIGYCDTLQRVMYTGEVLEGDSYDNLEVILMQLAPKECLVSSDTPSAELCRIRKVVERSGCLVTTVNKSMFASTEGKDIERFLKIKPSAGNLNLDYLSVEYEATNLATLNAAIRYINLSSDESAFGQYILSRLDLNRYVKLNLAAVRALNLFPPMDSSSNSSASIFGILNKCRTSQGQRLLTQWLKQPLIDKLKIEERLNVVEVIVNNIELQEQIGSALKRFPDFLRIIGKLQRKKSTLEEVYKIYESVKYLPSLLETLRAPNSPVLNSLFTSPLNDLHHDLLKFVGMVETTMDLDLVDNNEFVVKSSFDSELTRLRENLDELEASINKVFTRAAAELGMDKGKTIKLDHSPQLGYFFRITCKEEKAIRNSKRFIILETQKAGVRFTNNDLRSLNGEYTDIRSEYYETQKGIVNEIISITIGYIEPLMVLNGCIAQLDVLESFAITASMEDYVRPEILDDGSIIELEDVRHPCLANQISYIPNDATLDKSRENFLIITGPNMGGKSTYIRSIAVAVLMVQVGSYAPARRAKVSVVDSILGRVGAADNQLKGVSTFMAEMLETSSILRLATANSLVIIDELGRGTSTYDGFGLAWSISRHLATEVGCYCLFATHFHELTRLADEVANVGNLHVSALTDNGSLTMLYRVESGVCDRSFGIHVAEMVKFPASVVEFAKKKAAELEDVKCEDERIMEEFLNNVAELDVDNLTDVDLLSEISKIKNKYNMQSGNSII